MLNYTHFDCDIHKSAIPCMHVLVLKYVHTSTGLCVALKCLSTAHSLRKTNAG